MNEKEFKETWKGKQLPQVKQTQLTLKSYTGEEISVVGVAEVEVQYEKQVKSLPLVVVKGTGPSLLGREWMEAIKLNWGEIKHMRTDRQRLQDVLRRNEDVFREELGMLKGMKATIRVSAEARPKFYRPPSWTAKDSVLSQVHRWCLEGWPREVDVSYRPYSQRRLELSVKDGCVLWGARVRMSMSATTAMDQSGYQQSSMAVFIGNLGEYKEGQEDFESYTERFEQWMIVNEVGEDKKANVFLSVMGAEAYALLKNLCIPDKPSRLTYEVLCGKLSSHYKPKPLVIAERFKFQKRNQQENESVSAYVVALKQLSTHCEFGPHLDEALRDRFVSGLRVEAIQRKLLTEHNLTFAKACELSLSMEMASKNTLEFASKMKGPATVNRIDKKTTKGAWKSKPATSEWRSKTTSDNSRPQRTENHQPCYRCGGSNHAAQVCRYKTETCHKCSKVGHIARMCTTKDRQGHTQYVAESSNETTGNGNDDELFGSYPMNAVYPTYTVGNGKEEITVNVQLEGTPLEMQLDTGAAVTLVSEVVFKKHLSHLPVKESKVQLSTFSGEKIPLMGQVTVSAKYGNQSGDLPLVIVKGDRPALLGRNWLTNFRLDWASIFSVTPAGGCNNADVEAVLQKHKAVFSEELGTIREFKAKIAQSTLKDPVLCKVLELTRSGWPSHIKDERLKPYFTRKNELSVEQGCILWGIRVIIPPAHRERLLLLIRNFRGGKERWTKGTVEKRLGPVTYLVWNGVSRRSVHIDHLLYNQPSSPETLELPDEQLDVTNNYPAVVHADLGGKGPPGAVGGSPYSPEATPLIRMQANETLGTPSPDSVACDKAVTPANRAASSPEVLGRRYPFLRNIVPKVKEFLFIQKCEKEFLRLKCKRLKFWV
ncbi:hypothetical protein N1851_015749 [Merluccius polli]|uniref:CCHC-type domain-containing protein n=1 Tax=Merluccius polli TaxID=89951 RepID=A0AA47MSG4_MERPO|nr:hypothetical protein N1851_015749 [Merluccius polli]